MIAPPLPFVQYLSGGGDPPTSQANEIDVPLGVDWKPVGLLGSFTVGLKGASIKEKHHQHIIKKQEQKHGGLMLESDPLNRNGSCRL